MSVCMLVGILEAKLGWSTFMVKVDFFYINLYNAFQYKC